MPNDDIVIKASLDIRDIEKKLKKVRDDLDEMGASGSSATGQVSNGLVGAVAKGTLLANVIMKVAGALADAGKAAARFALNFTKDSVELSQQLEVIRNSLTILFEGNTQAADAFIQKTLQLSARLKTPFNELIQFTQGVLPDIGDIDTTFKLVEAATLLGRQSGKATVDIRRAIEELAVGQFRSARQILNLRPSDQRIIKEMAKDMGLAAASAEFLSKRVDSLAIGLNTLDGTLSAAVGDAKTVVAQIQSIYGEDVTKGLTSALNNLTEVFNDNKDIILEIFDDLGTGVGESIKVTGDSLKTVFEDIDFKKIREVIDAISSLSVNLSLLGDAITGEKQKSDDYSALASSLDKLSQAARTLAGIIALARVSLDYFGPSLKAAMDLTYTFSIPGNLSARNLAKVRDDLISVLESPVDAETANKNIEEFARHWAETQQVIEDINKNKAELPKPDTQSALDEGDAILRLKKLREDEAAAANDAAEARVAILKKEETQREKFSRALIENGIKEEQARLDAELDFARKREDIARKNAEAIADIETKNRQRIEDLMFDQQADEQKILKDSVSEEQRIRQDAANKNLQIEIDYRRRLEDIQLSFKDAAEEAVVRQDAIAYLRAKRDRERQIRDAKIARDRDKEDAKKSSSTSLADIKKKREQDLADLRDKNRVRLAEIERQHQRELAAQATKNSRELAAQSINEQRKLDDLKTNNIRRIQQIARNNAASMAAIEKGLKAEYDIIKKWEDLKTQLMIAEAENRKKKLLSIFGVANGAPSADPFATPFQRALQSSGYQTPTSAFFNPPSSPLFGSQSISATNTQQNTFNIGSEASLDAIQRSIIASLVPNVESIFS